MSEPAQSVRLHLRGGGWGESSICVNKDEAKNAHDEAPTYQELSRFSCISPKEYRVRHDRLDRDLRLVQKFQQ